MNKLDFCDAVEVAVQQQFGEADAGDLCWNLLETGVVTPDMGVENAARVVAMHILQA